MRVEGTPRREGGQVSAIAWRDRLRIADHSITVAMIVMAHQLEGVPPTKKDFEDLRRALWALRALSEDRS